MDTRALLPTFWDSMAGFALFPLSVALAIDVYLPARRVGSARLATLLAAGAWAVALVFFYGLELVQKRRRARFLQEPSDMSEVKPTPLSNKIRHVLTEARVALPGVQAVMAFQFIICLASTFEKLPSSSKVVHIIALLWVALAMLLLLTPAAYHRIAERGEETEHFHRVASVLVVSALGPLGLGLCLDLYVVILQVLHARWIAILAPAATLALMFGLWFGVSAVARHSPRHRREEQQLQRLREAHA